MSLSSAAASCLYCASRTSTFCSVAITCRTSMRSEEHTSELQSPCNLVCRLLLEKKKILDRRCKYAGVLSEACVKIEWFVPRDRDDAVDGPSLFDSCVGPELAARGHPSSISDVAA